MKKKIPLHTQILVALILGAIFGAFFTSDQHTLQIKYKKNATEYTTVFEKWNKISFIHEKYFEDESDSTVFFSMDDQVAIINYFNSLDASQKSRTKIQRIISGGAVAQSVRNASHLGKVKSIAAEIKPIGTLFIRLLSFLAIPLVIATLIVGAASLGDIRKLGRIGGQTFAIYISTTAIAITIGLFAANIIKPGEKVSEESKSRLIGSYDTHSTEKIAEDLEINVLDFLVQIVPKNPINAMANGKMIQIVFFSVLFGITLTLIDKKKSASVLNVFDGISQTMIKMVDLIMIIAPYGVFALIASTISEFGFDILSTLIWYIAAVLIGLLLQTAIVYPAIVRFIGKMGPLKFFRGIRNAQAVGFSTSSSAATLPVTLDCVENNLKMPKQISSFVLPLGATINMDGTALYQGVAAVFIAQVYGIDLGIVAQLTIVFTAVLASIGTAPVPGVGIIMLIIILQAINVPPEGIALILGVDRILDMCRTVANVTGDAAVAVAVGGREISRNNKLKK